MSILALASGEAPGVLAADYGKTEAGAVPEASQTERRSASLDPQAHTVTNCSVWEG